MIPSISSTFNPLAFLILKFRGRSVLVFRQDCHDYNNILTIARNSFQTLQSVQCSDLVLLASIPGYRDRSEVEVSRNFWPYLGAEVLKCAKSLTIALDSDLQGSEAYNFESKCSFSPASSTVASPGPTLQSVIHRQNDFAPPSFPFPSAKKPVIYLFPPSHLSDVTVELSLTPSWSFSAIYPSPQSTTRSGEDPANVQSITWDVQADSDGVLKEKTTGTEVTYLYWEAKVRSNLSLPSPDASRSTGAAEDIVGLPGTFNPSRPSVSPDDSVVLPINKVPDYLDVALKALTLHTEARTSFITFWLPSLLKYEFVALRFISQQSYEEAARMSISPMPDIVTRVFMLFRGVCLNDVDRWGPAVARAEGGATYWTEVVGVDAERASDRMLFRVLEWGGMEVKS